ncbi:carboxypeptidase-like regulatory domain-containing protein [Mucilaginibacter sp. HMF5004]|uniref:carboxypeptidase-like regulatory domain-containing protein n=1 Tax=Mucilaginibacter rivuli TaxID=2857527 RepID=UPI001C5E7CEE|nr:carboxypeptidase-like regulatory domain-containing protein [Mucilaginibacter rivuli]MBW4889908.1 carboxypeptidase-like regulatory domain-containing protein [Mucilaginibacter rivuli]
MKRILFIFIILVISLQATYAQMPLTGKVYELDKHTPLPSIKVQNTRTKDNTLTNTAGVFTIQAKAGDLLVLESFSYQPDTVLVTNARYIEVNMVLKVNNLNEVKIQNTTTKLGSLKDPTLHNQTVTYLTDQKGTGGIAIRFGYGKGSKEKKEEELARDTLTLNAIDKAFNPGNLGKYIPLKGTDMHQFIGLYRPNIKTFTAPYFNFVLYVHESYKNYLALTPQQRKLIVLKADSIKN